MEEHLHFSLAGHPQTRKQQLRSSPRELFNQSQITAARDGSHVHLPFASYSRKEGNSDFKRSTLARKFVQANKVGDDEQERHRKIRRIWYQIDCKFEKGWNSSVAYIILYTYPCINY